MSRLMAMPSEQELDALAHHKMKLTGPPGTGEPEQQGSLIPFLLTLALLVAWFLGIFFM